MTLIELYGLAERNGVFVDAFPLQSREALSMMDDSGICHIALDPSKLGSRADEKTKLGHELGHCATGSFYNRYSPFDLPAQHEHRAARWEIEHLVPEAELLAQVGDGRSEVWELAEHFGVTEELIRAALQWYRAHACA